MEQRLQYVAADGKIVEKYAGYSSWKFGPVLTSLDCMVGIVSVDAFERLNQGLLVGNY